MTDEFVPHDARSQSASLERGLRFAVGAVSLILVVLGVAVLAGWAFSIDRLTMVLPGHVTMKANTALGFICSGLGLGGTLFRSRSGRRWTHVFGALTAIIGLLSALEYMLHLDLRIDQLLVTDPLQFPYPGRMAGITSVNFSLSGIALLLLGRRGWSCWATLAAQAAVLATALTSVIGFLYGIPLLYGDAGIRGTISMAFHTGAGFLLLSLALLVADPTSWIARILTSPQTGGWIARRALPIVIFAPIGLGWLYLRSGIKIGGPPFSMALMAVTLVATGSAGVIATALILNRAELQRLRTAETLRVSAAAIVRSQRELQLVTDHLPTLISYIAPDGRYLRVNRTYETWLGRPAGEIVGRTLRELLGPAYTDATDAARRQAATGEIVSFQTIFPTIGGPRHVQVTYAPDFEDAGQLRGLACMVLDIEERTLAEAALLRSEKLAAVGRLASSIAHEINNPLEAVTNLLYLAEQETTLQPVAGYLAQAQTELNRVTHIVTQTLRFHRQSMNARPVRLAELVQQVLTLQHNRLMASKIEVEVRDREAKAVLCKEGEIRQVLANLIGNATDAMRDGGRLLIRTASTSAGSTATIADDGHGIPAEVRARLFEPFHTTKGDMGSGLGLWVSQEIVGRHGGSISVRSRTSAPGTGTVFRVKLPAGSTTA